MPPKKKQTPESNTYTEGEIGEPEQDPIPGRQNPGGVQSGRGPLKQEGEGNRQNDELAELKEIEPDITEEEK